jgi:hypothetical protein
MADKVGTPKPEYELNNRLGDLIARLDAAKEKVLKAAEEHKGVVQKEIDKVRQKIIGKIEDAARLTITEDTEIVLEETSIWPVEYYGGNIETDFAQVAEYTDSIKRKVKEGRYPLAETVGHISVAIDKLHATTPINLTESYDLRNAVLALQDLSHDLITKR